MFKYKTTRIYPGKAWRDDEGVQSPRNWNIWSAEEKAERGVIEITEDPDPDDRLYTWTKDSNGKITSTTAKNLDNIKAAMKKQIKGEQYTHLCETDWAVIRKSEKGTAVPTKIQTWRDAIRSKAEEMENAVDGCSTIEEMATLLKNTGMIHTWPELEE